MPLSFQGAEAQHRLVEAMKHAFALRLRLGDPGATCPPSSFMPLSAPAETEVGGSTGLGQPPPPLLASLARCQQSPPLLAAASLRYARVTCWKASLPQVVAGPLGVSFLLCDA